MPRPYHSLGLSGFWTVFFTTSDLIGVTSELYPSPLLVALIFFLIIFFQVTKVRVGKIYKSMKDFDRFHSLHSSETSQTASSQGLHQHVCRGEGAEIEVKWQRTFHQHLGP